MSGSPETPSDAADEGQQGRGLLIILSSPSGAGKTTLAHRLMEEFPAVSFSVSTTTRAPRGSERDGVDYHFVDDAEFDRMIADGAMAEWAEVHGNRYGTSRAAVEECLASGGDMIFDIDWQGGNALSARWPRDVLKVFIVPPSMAVLEARLRGRGTDAQAVIAERLARAVAEMRHFPEYDFVIVNDDFDDAYATLRAVYLSTRLDARAGGGGTGEPALAAGEAEPALHARAEGARVEVMRGRLEDMLGG